ncbi:putative pectinesterase 52 [Silene latifolia]|uniref:putative pectinesterase 52 n=1 Tax=Silene latifolia TaxID=37657 RepID=UPI003D7706F9
MQGLRPLYYFLTLQLLCVIICNASCVTNSKYGSKIANTIPTITVSLSGRANFTKIQQAVDSIPSGNNRWIRISVNPGTYREQVHIPYDKQCVVLEGAGSKVTKIVFDGHAATDSSSTFISSADNVVAKNIGFMNSYNNPGSGPVPVGVVKQAVAASVYGDKSAFYNCEFIGYQDTLWDVSGRHFYKSCYIEGAIDFIWGNGRSFYEDCNIKVIGDGFITAQERASPNEQSGFVFEKGSVFGNGHAFLGRALSGYSTVIFKYTDFSSVVDPLGWDARGRAGHEGDLTFVEIKCTGVGANKSKRVPWEKTLDQQSELKFTRHVFVDEDNWINQQP